MKQLLKLTGCVALAGLMSSCGSVQEEANYPIATRNCNIASKPLYFEKRCENPLSGRK